MLLGAFLIRLEQWVNAAWQGLAGRQLAAIRIQRPHPPHLLRRCCLIISAFVEMVSAAAAPPLSTSA